MSHHAEAYRSRLVPYEELVAGIQPDKFDRCAYRDGLVKPTRPALAGTGRTHAIATDSESAGRSVAS
jgi:hypothetical protein